MEINSFPTKGETMDNVHSLDIPIKRRTNVHLFDVLLLWFGHTLCLGTITSSVLLNLFRDKQNNYVVHRKDKAVDVTSDILYPERNVGFCLVSYRVEQCGKWGAQNEGTLTPSSIGTYSTSIILQSLDIIVPQFFFKDNA